VREGRGGVARPSLPSHSLLAVGIASIHNVLSLCGFLLQNTELCIADGGSLLLLSLFDMAFELWLTYDFYEDIWGVLRYG
jgi:hypothetical protein